MAEGSSWVIQINQTGEWDLPETLLEKGLEATLQAEGAIEGELSLSFIRDEEIQALNLKYLDRDCSTDVIAFTLSDAGAPILGDVYVGYEQAGRQAEELGVGLEEELLRLSIHGALHVLGHDHPEGDERGECEMFRLQEELLKYTLRTLPG